MSGSHILRRGLRSSELAAEDCIHCKLHELCFISGIGKERLEELDGLLSERRMVARGQSLYHAAEPFNAFFAVRAGFFKTTVASEDGHEQIIGFQMPGELMGLEGLAHDVYGVNAVALDDSEVCVLEYSNLEAVSAQLPELQLQIQRLMSREIVREQGVLMLLGGMRAEERVAAFLINLSMRYGALGYSSQEFVLRMTRADIGSFLGLQIETVSRTFTRMQVQGLIEVQGREVRLLQADSLRAVAGNRLARSGEATVCSRRFCQSR